MNARTPPPAGLRWTDGTYARAAAILLAVVSIVVSLYVGYRYVGLVDCLQARDTSDQTRTLAIAEATDSERRADAMLLASPGPDARAADIAARKHTDDVRAAHPAPPVVPCN